MTPSTALVLETHNLKGGDAASHAVASLGRLLVHLRRQTLPLAELDELLVTHQGLDPDQQSDLERVAGRAIRFVALPTDADYYQAKNAGFDASAAERVVFGESDCWPAEGWLENLLSPFADSTVCVVAGRTCYRGGVLGSAASSIDFNYYDSPLGAGCTRNFYANNVAFRRDIFAAHRYGAGEHFYRGNCQTLGLRLQAAGVPVRFEPNARTTHRFPDTWAELARLRILRGGDLAELSPRLLGAHVRGAALLPRPVATAVVWSARVALSLGALGRQDMPPLDSKWPLAAATTVALCVLDGAGAAARLAGLTRPKEEALAYHADVDRLAAAEM
jgi:hypothetical protein